MELFTQMPQAILPFLTHLFFPFLPLPYYHGLTFYQCVSIRWWTDNTIEIISLCSDMENELLLICQSITFSVSLPRVMERLRDEHPLSWRSLLSEVRIGSYAFSLKRYSLQIAELIRLLDTHPIQIRQLWPVSFYSLSMNMELSMK